MKRALLTTLAVAGSLAVAVPVFAQQASPGQGGPQGGQRQMMHRIHGGPGGGGFARMCENHDARLAGMLAFAEKRLNITDAQKPAWNKFADQARASHKPVQDLCTSLKDKPQPTNAIERLERMDAVMTARQAQFHQLLPAVKEMYGQLTPDQQKVAEELLSRGPRFGGHGPGHGPRRG
ncbi:MAG TPA: Spy/CpxP family protein refolding chaperone [Azospirillum sp.]|nr:Spy/CpxP family protein refolding chaperone [Azospirillum sp.]